MIKKLPLEIWKDRIKSYCESGMTLAKWYEANDVSVFAMKYYMYDKNIGQIIVMLLKKLIRHSKSQHQKWMNQLILNAIPMLVPIKLVRPADKEYKLLPVKDASIKLEFNGISMKASSNTNLELLKENVEVLK